MKKVTVMTKMTAVLGMDMILETLYETAGLAAGVNGTYSLSTGNGSVGQQLLDQPLSITDGSLDGSMISIDDPGSKTKPQLMLQRVPE